MAQSVYVRQAAEAQADKAAGKPYSIPKSVGQIAQELAQQALTNPEQAKTIKKWWGANQTKVNPQGEYEEPSPQEPSVNSKTTKPEQQSPQYNDRQKKVMEDPKFKALSKDKQQEVLDGLK